MPRRFILLPSSNQQGSILGHNSNSNAIVVLGANGSGKTRFGYRIEELNKEATHRITAQKSLLMPDTVSTKTANAAELDYMYGYGASTITDRSQEWIQSEGKKSWKYGNRPNTNPINDYETLMTLVFSEEFDAALEFKEGSKLNTNMPNVKTKLDDIISIWEKVLPHRKLKKKAGSITTMYQSEQLYIQEYKGSEMSDGERVIFYLIASAISIRSESILIIDEPELHIHKSILNNLFDEIEKARPDILFVYLTHDIDFTITRSGADKIWLKSFKGNGVWDYEFLPKQSEIPENIYFQILGSRKPILFVEGTKDSPDYELYSPLFPDYTVQPVGGCNQVIDATKTFNKLNSLHRLRAIGIIDRDRRTDAEVKGMEHNSIHVLKVAEIENVYLIEGVVKILAKRNFKDSVIVFNSIKAKVIEAFREDIDTQIMQHTIHRIKMKLSGALSSDLNNWQRLEEELNKSYDLVSFREIYDGIKQQFEGYVSAGDYESILKIANIKNLLTRSNLAIECGMANSAREVRSQVIGIVKSDLPESLLICNTITTYIFSSPLAPPSPLRKEDVEFGELIVASSSGLLTGSSTNITSDRLDLFNPNSDAYKVVEGDLERNILNPGFITQYNNDYNTIIEAFIPSLYMLSIPHDLAKSLVEYIFEKKGINIYLLSKYGIKK